MVLQREVTALNDIAVKMFQQIEPLIFLVFRRFGSINIKYTGNATNKSSNDLDTENLHKI